MESFPPNDLNARWELSRREFVRLSVSAGAALAFSGANARLWSAPGAPSPGGLAAAPTHDIGLRVNGAEHRLTVESRETLLDVLRERLLLTGTKKGCDHGQCGACTVLVDGQRINSCLTLAVVANGAEITTVEGLARGDELHPVQAAFIKHDAFQCGYCTPGQLCSAVGLLAEGHAHTEAEIREQMSGNICRCGAYPNIVAAVREAGRGPA